MHLSPWATRAVPPQEPPSAEAANSSPHFPEDCNYPAGSSQANSNRLHVFLTECSIRETEPHCRSENQTHSGLRIKHIKLILPLLQVKHMHLHVQHYPFWEVKRHPLPQPPTERSIRNLVNGLKMYS